MYKTRCTEIQTCPLLTNAPHFTRSINSSVNSTSSSIITAAFDPSSNVTRFNPAFALIPSPTFGLPVKVMEATSSFVTIASPTVEPYQ